MAAEVRYIIANRHQLFILRCSDRGIRIEPYHKSHHQKQELLIPYATQAYVVCEDQKENLHIVFIDPSNQLMHASIHFFASAHTDPISVSIQLIDSSLHEIPMQLELQYCHNSLQLLLRYEHAVIHYQLAGVHWSSPTILEQSASYISLQMHHIAEQAIACLGIMQYPDLIVHLLKYEHATSEWKLLKQCTLSSGWEGTEPIFLSSNLVKDTDLHLQLLRFPKGKLFLKQYKLLHDSADGNLIPYRESMLLTPIRRVQTALCVQDEESLHLSWLTDEQLYRSTYYINRDAWGSLQAVYVDHPVQWILLSPDHTLPFTYSHWVTSTGDWQHLHEQLGARIDIYHARRDLQNSVTYAASSISSLGRLSQIKQQMIHDIHQLEETLRLSSEQILHKHKRLEVLGEERDIRHTLDELMRAAYSQHHEDQAPSLLIANVQGRSALNASTVKVQTVEQELGDFEMQVSPSSGIQQPTSIPEDQPFRQKLISLLQRMTTFR